MFVVDQTRVFNDTGVLFRQQELKLLGTGEIDWQLYFHSHLRTGNSKKKQQEEDWLVFKLCYSAAH